MASLFHALVALAVLLVHRQAAAEDRPIPSSWHPVLPAFLRNQVREMLGGLQAQVERGERNGLKVRGISFMNGRSLGVKSLVTPLESYALFSMRLQIGSLQKNISAIIDTGSEAFLVQCGRASQPVYDPAQSQTYRKVTCDSPLCQAVQQSFASNASQVQPCFSNTDNATVVTSNNSSCSYSLSYGDSRVSSGDFSQDVIGLNSTGGIAGRTTQFGDVAFGCAHSAADFLVDINSLGIVGFNRGNLSLPSQLKDKLGGRKFSYCFPSTPWQPRATGIIFLGESGLTTGLTSFTPLLDNPVFPGRSRLYYISLTSVSVDGKTLAISESAFKVNPVSGDGGTVLDSGTTFTRLVEDAYVQLRNAFDAVISHSNGTIDLKKKVGPVAGFDDCYNISAGSGVPRIPTVAFIMENDVKLDLQFEHLFVPVSAGGNEVTICLAILSSERSGMGKLNIIGNFQQSNYLIEYDNERSRVGFNRADCNSASLLFYSTGTQVLFLVVLVGRMLVQW